MGIKHKYISVIFVHEFYDDFGTKYIQLNSNRSGFEPNVLMNRNYKTNSPLDFL